MSLFLLRAKQLLIDFMRDIFDDPDTTIAVNAGAKLERIEDAGAYLNALAAESVGFFALVMIGGKLAVLGLGQNRKRHYWVYILTCLSICVRFTAILCLVRRVVKHAKKRWRITGL